MRVVEHYHAPIKRACQILRMEGRESGTGGTLQIVVKAVNDSSGPNGLIPTLLVFGALPR